MSLNEEIGLDYLPLYVSPVNEMMPINMNNLDEFVSAYRELGFTLSVF